jgi:hypothetical protein
MVVTPLVALADVGATWEDWGGVWGGAKDPVHFQYPGFDLAALSSDSPSQSDNLPTIGQWIEDALGKIPTFLQFFLPAGFLETRAATPTDIARIKKILGPSYFK